MSSGFFDLSSQLEAVSPDSAPIDYSLRRDPRLYRTAQRVLPGEIERSLGTARSACLLLIVCIELLMPERVEALL